jgi:hypothetical protein
MSPARDWTDPAAWAEMMTYEAAEFAAEYLLRNDEFVAECRTQMEEREAPPGELIGSPEFAAQWGLRFHRSE